MKPLTDTEVVFGILPWAEDQIALRAGDALHDGPGIGLQRRAVIRPVIEVFA